MAKTHTPVVWLEGIKEHTENGKVVIFQAGDKIEGTGIPESEIQRYIGLGLCREFETDKKNGGIIGAPQPQLSEADLAAIAEEAERNGSAVDAQMGKPAKGTKSATEPTADEKAEKAAKKPKSAPAAEPTLEPLT